MSAETTLPRHSSDPSAMPRAVHMVNTPYSGPIPMSPYRPVAQDPTPSRAFGSRRIKRLTETREIRIRTTHRRRKLFARGGVLAGFGLAMVVYPIMGNVVTYHSGAENVPGVVLGEAPTTGHALLGDGPQLIPTIVDLPSVDAQAQALAVARAETPYVLEQSLPDCVPPAQFDAVDNGQLPANQLCALWGGSQMRADAAIALAQMNEQFKAAFGRDICIQEGYRSYADQVRIKALRGYLAASPGTSMHGFGLAFDLCAGDDSGAPLRWLNANAAAFGYFNPDWAKYRKYEPWHWEYAPGVNSSGHYGGSEWADGALDAGTSGPVLTDPADTAVTDAAATDSAAQTTDPTAAATP